MIRFNDLFECLIVCILSSFFDVSEVVFDRVEFGSIGRQEEEYCAGAFDELACSC